MLRCLLWIAYIQRSHVSIEKSALLSAYYYRLMSRRLSYLLDKQKADVTYTTKESRGSHIVYDFPLTILRCNSHHFIGFFPYHKSVLESMLCVVAFLELPGLILDGILMATELKIVEAQSSLTKDRSLDEVRTLLATATPPNSNELEAHPASRPASHDIVRECLQIRYAIPYLKRWFSQQTVWSQRTFNTKKPFQAPEMARPLLNRIDLNNGTPRFQLN